MPAPLWRVEIAFASTPLETAPTWTDVSDWVVHSAGIKIRRGRQSPLQPFNTGVAQFRLDNRDRRFDPLYASSPYVGNLLPGKQVRITANAGSDVRQFTGFVAGFPQSLAGVGRVPFVDVDCYDGLGWLAESRALDDLSYDYALSLGTLNRALRRASTGSWFTATSNNNNAWLEAGASTTEPTMLAGVPGAQSSAVIFDGVTRWRNPLVVSTAGWSLSFWFRSTGQGVMMGYNGASAGLVYLALNPTGTLTYYSATPSPVYSTTTIREGLNDGQLHHCAVVQASSGMVDIYVDGVLQSVTTVGGIGAYSLGVRDYGSIPDTGFTGYTGSLQDVFIWTFTTLTAAAVRELYDRGLGTLVESTSTRAGRVLDAVGWPASWRDLTTNPSGMCTTPPFAGAQAITLLREAETTEQGRLFAAKDGDITLLNRYWTTDATRGNTIQATFSDDGSDIAYLPSMITQDKDDVLNDVTVSIRSTGSASRSQNSSSITAYGRRSETIETLLPDLTVAAAMADGIVQQRKDALTRITPVDPDFVNSNSEWTTLLGLEIGDRVRLEVTPNDVGPQIQQQATIEAITIDADDRSTRFGFVAAPIPAVSWFRLDSSALDGPDLLGF